VIDQRPPGLTCPACDGHGRETGCPECNGRGEYEVIGCPCAYVTPDVWHALELTDWASGDARILPVAGGVLDQAISFMDTLKFVRSDEARIKAARATRRR